MTELNNLTPEELTLIQAHFAMWRFHLWSLNCGSYDEIEESVKRGLLTPFVCPRKDCDCHWRKDWVMTEQKELP